MKYFMGCLLCLGSLISCAQSTSQPKSSNTYISEDQKSSDISIETVNEYARNKNIDLQKSNGSLGFTYHNNDETWKEVIDLVNTKLKNCDLEAKNSAAVMLVSFLLGNKKLSFDSAKKSMMTAVMSITLYENGRGTESFQDDKVVQEGLKYIRGYLWQEMCFNSALYHKSWTLHQNMEEAWKSLIEYLNPLKPETQSVFNDVTSELKIKCKEGGEECLSRLPAICLEKAMKDYKNFNYRDKFVELIIEPVLLNLFGEEVKNEAKYEFDGTGSKDRIEYGKVKIPIKKYKSEFVNYIVNKKDTVVETELKKKNAEMNSDYNKAKKEIKEWREILGEAEEIRESFVRQQKLSFYEDLVKKFGESYSRQPKQTKSYEYYNYLNECINKCDNFKLIEEWKYILQIEKYLAELNNDEESKEINLDIFKKVNAKIDAICKEIIDDKERGELAGRIRGELWTDTQITLESTGNNQELPKCRYKYQGEEYSVTAKPITYARWDLKDSYEKKRKKLDYTLSSLDSVRKNGFKKKFETSILYNRIKNNAKILEFNMNDENATVARNTFKNEKFKPALDQYQLMMLQQFPVIMDNIFMNTSSQIFSSIWTKERVSKLTSSVKQQFDDIEKSSSYICEDLPHDWHSDESDYDIQCALALTDAELVQKVIRRYELVVNRR